MECLNEAWLEELVVPLPHCQSRIRIQGAGDLIVAFAADREFCWTAPASRRRFHLRRRRPRHLYRLYVIATSFKRHRYAVAVLVATTTTTSSDDDDVRSDDDSVATLRRRDGDVTTMASMT